MNRILFENRSKCSEEVSIVKKRKTTTKSEGKALQYPESNEIKSKTFLIKYEKKLSLIAKFILNSFQNKYIYYAMDDILYRFELDSSEYQALLTILYSPIISLQNNYAVNFFDIWINEVYIEESFKPNRFLTKTSQTYNQFSYITLKLFYKTRIPMKTQDSLW